MNFFFNNESIFPAKTIKKIRISLSFLQKHNMFFRSSFSILEALLWRLNNNVFLNCAISYALLYCEQVRKTKRGLSRSVVRKRLPTPDIKDNGQKNQTTIFRFRSFPNFVTTAENYCVQVHGCCRHEIAFSCTPVWFCLYFQCRPGTVLEIFYCGGLQMFLWSMKLYRIFLLCISGITGKRIFDIFAQSMRMVGHW